MENNYINNTTPAAMQITSAQLRDVDSETNFNGLEIHVPGSTLNTGSDHTWRRALNSAYRFTSNATISDNVTIEEGAVMLFDNNVLLRFTSSSTVKVLGSASDPVVFRGSVELAGSWRGIVVESTTLENTFQHAEFAHAGHSNLMSGFGRAALGFANNARATLSNLHFSDIDGYGVYVRHGSSSAIFNDLTFGSGLTQGAVYMVAANIKDLDTDSDFGNNYVVVDGGTIPDGTPDTWPALNNGKYLFTSNSDISNRINIEAGAVLEFESNILIRFRNVVVAQGTATNPVVFTRKAGTIDHWRGISIESSSNENLFAHVEVSHAGHSNLMSGFLQTNIGLANNARLTLPNSTVSNSLGYGVYIRPNAQLTQSGNTFASNPLGDIFE